MSIKIKNIIPVTGAVVTPEMIAHIGKYLSPDTQLITSISTQRTQQTRPSK